MKMMTVNNQHIKKLLLSSPGLYNEKGLNPEQIKWRMENSRNVLGLIGKTGFFGKAKQMILVEKEENAYMLLCPATRKDAYPNFLYDIIDIDEFCRNFPVRAFVYDDERDIDMDILFDDLQTLKNKKAKGFIEFRNNEPFVYELVII